MVVVKFHEYEASTEGMFAKIKDALQNNDPLVLIDAQGNDIVDSEVWKPISSNVMKKEKISCKSL